MTTKSLSEIVERFGLLLFLINENIKDEFACRNLLSDVDNVIAENDQDAAPYLVGLIMSKILNPKEDSEVKAMMFLVITNALKKSGDLYGQIFACHFKFIDPEVFVKLTNDRLFKIKFVVSEWKAFKDIFDVAVTNELLARITEQLEEAQRKEPIIHNKASGFQRARYYQAEIQHAHLNPLLIPDVVRNMRRHHHQQEGEMFGKKRHHGSTSDYMEDRETKVQLPRASAPTPVELSNLWMSLKAGGGPRRGPSSSFFTNTRDLVDDCDMGAHLSTVHSDDDTDDEDEKEDRQRREELRRNTAGNTSEEAREKEIRESREEMDYFAEHVMSPRSRIPPRSRTDLNLKNGMGILFGNEVSTHHRRVGDQEEDQELKRVLALSLQEAEEDEEKEGKEEEEDQVESPADEEVDLGGPFSSSYHETPPKCGTKDPVAITPLRRGETDEQRLRRTIDAGKTPYDYKGDEAQRQQDLEWRRWVGLQDENNDDYADIVTFDLEDGLVVPEKERASEGIVFDDSDESIDISNQMVVDDYQWSPLPNEEKGSAQSVVELMPPDTNSCAPDKESDHTNKFDFDVEVTTTGKRKMQPEVVVEGGSHAVSNPTTRGFIMPSNLPTCPELFLAEMDRRHAHKSSRRTHDDAGESAEEEQVMKRHAQLYPKALAHMDSMVSQFHENMHLRHHFGGPHRRVAPPLPTTICENRARMCTLKTQEEEDYDRAIAESLVEEREAATKMTMGLKEEEDEEEQMRLAIELSLMDAQEGGARREEKGVVIRKGCLKKESKYD